MISSINKLTKELSSLGLKAVSWRLLFEVKRRTGLSARLNVAKRIDVFVYLVKKNDLQSSLNFNVLNYSETKFDSLRALLNDGEKNAILNEANQLIDYKFVRFGCEVVALNGLNWHYEPQSGIHWPAHTPSSKLLTVFERYGDIKLLWEIARCSWLMVLARAHLVSGDERYLDFGLQAIIDFGINNPQNLGVHWTSEQEVAIRIYNIIWFWSYCKKAHYDTGSIDDKLAAIVLMHQDYLTRHLDYAAQAIRNNHLIHGLVGVLLAGEFLGLKAPGKREKWLNELEISLEEQWYEDGGYVQPSFIYHRSALYGLLIFYKLASTKSEYSRFLEPIKKVLNKSSKQLISFVSSFDGSLPNWGANDGSRVFSISAADYSDFRPIINLLELVNNRVAVFDSIGCCEESFWLLGICDHVKVGGPPKKETSKYFKDQGLASINIGDLGVLFRCGDVKNRYALQADQLHLDLSIKEKRVLVDSGSYNYNKQLNWHNYFRGTYSHNTIIVNECSQMQPHRKFKFLDWSRSAYYSDSQIFGDKLLAGGCHDGYFRLKEKVLHARFIFRKSLTGLMVIDRVWSVSGKAVDTVRLNWNVQLDISRKSLATPYFVSDGDISIQIVSETNLISNIVRGEDESPRGWVSPSYNSLMPVNSWLVTSGSSSEYFFATLIDSDEEVQENSFEEILGKYSISKSKLIEISDQLGESLVERS